MLKAGIIGLGHGSRVLIDAFQLNNIEVYGVASKNYAKACKISKERGISKTYRSWKDLVGDNKINIVAVAVPAYLQINILKECIKKNKNILCEKPLGIDYKKINNILLILSQYKKFFFIDYIFSEHRAFKKFYRLISRKKIYDNDYVVVKFNTQTYTNKNQIVNWKVDSKKGGGIVNLFLSHIIDYLIWFFGPIKNVYCTIDKVGKKEIRANCLIEFKSNMKAKIFINIDNPKKYHSIQFISKRFQLVLKNSSSDYCKNFKIYYKKIDKKNKYILSHIPYKDFTSDFKGDSRILLTSRIIKKMFKNINKSSQSTNIKRFKYNEYILNFIRKSVKENRTINII